MFQPEIVRDTDEDAPRPPIPMFEGKPVSACKLRITSTASLDVGDQVLKVDDIIRITVDARVSQVHHNVNERTGDLERVQTAKALSVEITPWNPDDPNDTGVFRV
jgi:hypothetical protein